MFLLVLVLALTNMFLTASLFRIVRNEKYNHFHQIDFGSDVPFLQLIVPDLTGIENENENESEIPIPEPIPAPVSEGPWRNQKDIQPWSPNSSAQSSGAPQERKPLERPPGFAS